MKRFLLLLIIIAGYNMLYVQNRSIKGIVSDADGASFAGCSAFSNTSGERALNPNLIQNPKH